MFKSFIIFSALASLWLLAIGAGATSSEEWKIEYTPFGAGGNPPSPLKYEELVDVTSSAQGRIAEIEGILANATDKQCTVILADIRVRISNGKEVYQISSNGCVGSHIKGRSLSEQQVFRLRDIFEELFPASEYIDAFELNAQTVKMTGIQAEAIRVAWEAAKSKMSKESKLDDYVVEVSESIKGRYRKSYNIAPGRFHYDDSTVSVSFSPRIRQTAGSSSWVNRIRVELTYPDLKVVEVKDF